MFDSRVFVVADGDRGWRQHVADQLTADGASVLVADDRARALARCGEGGPDVLMLGQVDGPAATMGLVRELGSSTRRPGEPHRDLPVLVALGDDGELAVPRAFDAGADAVTIRSVGYAVLRARLRALPRRERERRRRCRSGRCRSTGRPAG